MQPCCTARCSSSPHWPQLHLLGDGTVGSLFIALEEGGAWAFPGAWARARGWPEWAFRTYGGLDWGSRDFSPETHFQAHLGPEQPGDKVSEPGGPDGQAGHLGGLMSSC